MAYAPQKGDAQVSLSVYGGLVTNSSGPTLPEGVSPDTCDSAFLPGSVFSRPALKRVFAQPFPPSGPINLIPTITYGKSFVGPNGGIENLYLDSEGNLYWEDPVFAPGVRNLIGTFTRGSWAKSITAFGREYIAISDGAHGSDVPVQWDGANLDRVTQDGPGSPPTAASIALPTVGLTTTGAIVLALTEADPQGPSGGNFTTINIWTSNSVAGINAGDAITLSGYGGGSAAMNGTWPVLAIYGGGSGGYANLLVLSASLPNGTEYALGGTATVLTGELVRKNNIVTAICSTPHQLQVGYQAQLGGVIPTAIGGGVVSIVINNELNPGAALVTTNSAHGLVPGCFVSLTAIAAVAVGSGIATIGWAGGIVTVTTPANHGMTAGSLVAISGTTAFNCGAAVIASTPGPKIFTYYWTPIAAPAGETAGTVSLTWPVPDTADPTYYEVLSAPTATTFQVQITYSNGTWTSGVISFAWAGTFPVTAVPSPTTFQYQQYGPDATYNHAAGAVETVTPYGQVAPGVRKCQVLFVTRNGAITRGSPPVQLVANGGQYLAISNIPIGPPPVVGRILSFTGAAGANFYYIPATPQVNGQIVGTATQIDDNTTTSVLLDFSDPTLFAASGLSIPGNNVAQQIVLDGALGFGLYASRLATWGQRNIVQSLLNMGFDGGYLPAMPTLPTGWIPGAGGPGGILAPGHVGTGWQATGGGSIYQSCFQDAYGAPILTAAQPYIFRAWVKGAGTSVTATISSQTTGFSATATLNGAAVGGFSQAAFSATMPSPIPPDMVLALTWAGLPLVDEMSLSYADNPYTNTVINMSYVDNPEALDGLTGVIGSTQDQHQVMDLSNIRQTCYFLTQDPNGRLHEFSDNGVTEPSGWTVNQVASNCGIVGPFALTKSQANDASSSGGEEWFTWVSTVGARIFGGDQPWEISREIYPDWAEIVQNFRNSCWALNDPASRTIYYGLALPGNPSGGATRVYSLNYVGLDSAYAIGTTGPIRISFSGKRIATDHSRKWCRWNSNVRLNGAALMYRSADDFEPVFFGGNGTIPGMLPGTGNVYTLNPTQFTDDDYGQLTPYWTTFFMPSEEQETALQLGGFRKLLVYVIAYIGSPVNCNCQFTPYIDQLSRPGVLSVIRPLTQNPARDLEFGGCSAQGNRIALKIAAQPLAGQTDCGYNLQRLTAFIRKSAHLPVRGAQ